MSHHARLVVTLLAFLGALAVARPADAQSRMLGAGASSGGPATIAMKPATAGPSTSVLGTSRPAAPAATASVAGASPRPGGSDVVARISSVQRGVLGSEKSATAVVRGDRSASVSTSRTTVLGNTRRSETRYDSNGSVVGRTTSRDVAGFQKTATVDPVARTVTVTTSRPTILGGTRTTTTTFDANGNQSNRLVTRSNPHFGTSTVKSTMSTGTTVTDKTRTTLTGGVRTETTLRDANGKELFKSNSSSGK